MARGPAYEKMVAAWCSKDRQTAINRPMLGEPVSAASWNHPLDSQVRLGSKAHVVGSPTIMTETGQRIEGHVDAIELATMLGVAKLK